MFLRDIDKMTLSQKVMITKKKKSKVFLDIHKQRIS